MPIDAIVHDHFGSNRLKIRNLIDSNKMAHQALARGGAEQSARLTTWRLDYQKLVRISVAFFVFLGFIAIVEPSPYDFAFFLALPVWFCGGFRLNRTVLLLAALFFAYDLGGFVSLIPYLHETDPRVFMLLSLYLAFSAVFFAFFLAEDSERRGELCLKACAWGAVLAAACGIVGYLGLFGLGDIFSRYGRASGTFKDPNVLGSFLVIGGVYFMQRLVLTRSRHVVVDVLSLLVIVAAIFLSFSRGSWGAFVVAAALCVGSAYLTSADRRMRRRIIVMTAAAIAVVVCALAIVLSMSETRDLFFQRAALEQDYDGGATGRFGNQARSIPMLLDHINGLGPLRFRLIFGLEPHDTYINAFASYGWLGGFAFALLVGLTTYIGFRLILRPSPYRRLAQVYWPSLFVFFLQAFQIDIDHWRYVYFLLGAVWGLEAARRRWEVRQTLPVSSPGGDQERSSRKGDVPAPVPA